MLSSARLVLTQELLESVLRVRRVEERVGELFDAGRVQMPVHLSIGQEAVAAGVAQAVRPNDKAVSTHRCHGHYLALGGDMGRMLAELFGRQDGCCGGKGGTMHLFDEESGLFCSSPLVGASISFAVGVGLASKMRGDGAVAFAFFGDGAVEEGIFWESVNFASVHRIPVIFVCENNLYATHSHILNRQPAATISPRVEAHGLKTFLVDGNDAVAVYEAAQKAVEYAKEGQPCFLEAMTYRWKEHWGVGDDWELGYRAKEEVELWKRRCPLQKIKESFLEAGGELELYGALEAKIQTELEAAIDFAESSPRPEPDQLENWG